MALSISKPTAYSDSIRAAYWKITQADVDSMSQTVTFSIDGWYGASERLAGKRALTSMGGYASAIDLSQNALNQAYTYLKTLPEFAGATDV